MASYDIQINDPGALLSETDRTLLTMLARQTGADLRDLTQKYLAGDLNGLIASLPSAQRTAARKIISDPAAMEKMKQTITPETVLQIIKNGKKK